MITLHFDVPPDLNTPDPSAPAPKVGRPIFGDYQVEGELGRGGMGVVFRARQKGLNRLVALKMLTGRYGPDELARFKAEAETAASLHHTNIVQIYEVGEDEGAPFFSMEYIETGSLADRLRGRVMPAREGAQLLISVARALHFAHQNGVVHRDMKPANVLLDPEGVPKVTDFGIAKRLSGESSLTQSGAVIGTPTYMAPEQAKGTSRDVGAAADVYSLGAILYEILAGRPPFLPEDSETALTVRVITEDPVSPAWHRPGTPRDLETICMKCLEKQPRDRYASAAAFAEDLRRYLEDESIMARPPTTVARAIKWTKRHPWRTSFAIAALVFLGIGLERLWRWEFYERPHVEWAETIDMVQGVAQPIVRCNAEEAARRGITFRLTRRGRAGAVTSLEILNPRGRPALVREVFGSDIFSNWVEGAMGAQKTNDRSREAVRINFIYTGGELAETTALDRNGHVTWRLLWNRVAEEEKNHHIVRARFVDLRGFDFSSTQGASHVQFLRDAAGLDIEVRFFNGSGKPAPNNEEVYGFRVGRDAAGRVTQLTNLDQNGQPMENRIGMISQGLSYDSRGYPVRYEFRDGEGKPAPWKNVAVTTFDYDTAGNITAIRRLNAENKPVNGEWGDWAVLEYKRNALGELIDRVYQKVAADGSLSQILRTQFEYDGAGYLADSKVIGPESVRTQWVRDPLGNVLEKRVVDLDGHPKTVSEGWSIIRYAYSDMASPPGWREEFSLFDTKGEKAWMLNGGFHRSITEFHSTGDVYRVITEDQNPAPGGFFRSITEPEFDTQQRMRKFVLRKEDKEGKLISGPGLTGILEKEFDDDGRLVSEWLIGSDTGTTGAPAWHTTTEWHRTGTEKRMAKQACDLQRKPLPYIATGTGARTEYYYDEIGQRDRIYETGFDEKVVGFNVRETKFAGGEFQSVTHKRSDGSMVDAVHVFITEVNPQQPKAAELKVGDQLLAANDHPVHSAYEWVFTKFPGGWIEVVRDGKTVRIEGFEAGSTGITLVDRAAPAKQ
ncbi:MAG: eukaryotic-like serine/threonine-protein kinase [Verrucomicrobiota bacterium]|jgi:predicted Ser/Thr protein kinase